MPDDKLTVEKAAEQINKSIDELKSQITEKADLSKLEEKFTEINGKFDTLMSKEEFAKHEVIVKQQEQMDEISTQLKQLGEAQGAKAKSLREQFREEFGKDAFKNRLKEKGGLQNYGFEVKAANIDTADINSGTIEDEVEVGVAKAPWRNTPIWDNINKGVIGQGRDQISWWEETTRTDSAEMVAEEAAPSAGSAKTWTKQSMNIMMIKDYTKVSREALEDFEYITSEIQDLMQNGIPRLRETQLLEGVGTTVYLKGITQYAKTFACPSNFDKVAAPNAGDVLAAALLQVKNGNTSDTAKRGYMPNLVLVNPGDRVNMRLLKNQVESYLQHPMLSLDGTRFDGVRIEESLDLDAGQFIVGDFSRAKAYVKRAMRISFHYENEDDVLNDLVLVLASHRIAGLKVATPDAYAFVTGTIAAGIPLINAG